MARSTARWSRASKPSRKSAISPLTLRDGRQDALAAVALATVAQLHRLVDAGRRARWNDGPPGGARVEHDLHLDGRVAAGVEDLPADYLFDHAHCRASLLLAVWETLPPAPRPTRVFRALPPPDSRAARTARGLSPGSPPRPGTP